MLLYCTGTHTSTSTHTHKHTHAHAHATHPYPHTHTHARPRRSGATDFESGVAVATDLKIGVGQFETFAPYDAQRGTAIEQDDILVRGKS